MVSKTIPLLLASSLFACMQGRAQQLSVGARAGATFSSWNPIGDDAEGLEDFYSNVVGFQAGIPVELTLPGPVALEADLTYMQRGYQNDLSDLFGDDAAQTLRIDYAELTAVAKLGTDTESFNAAFVVGPSVGYALRGRSRGEGAVQGDERIDWDESDLRRTDLGLVLGVQSSASLGTGKLVVDARYRFGLTERFDVDPADVGGVDLNARSRTLSFAFGYLYPLN